MNIAVDLALVVTTGVSMSVAAVMVWYVRKLLMKMTILAELQKETLDEIEEYSEHLEVINGLETFYGDETLGALLEHTKNLAESLAGKIANISFIEEYTDEDGEGEEYGE